MGWASGSQLLSAVLDATLKHIPKNKRTKAVKDLVEAFEEHDCDTIEEVWDDHPIVKKVCLEMHPDRYEMDGIDLTNEEIDALEAFVNKVSMEGFTYALKNYPPKGLPKDVVKKIRGANGDEFLESLMGMYGVEYC